MYAVGGMMAAAVAAVLIPHVSDLGTLLALVGLFLLLKQTLSD